MVGIGDFMNNELEWMSKFCLFRNVLCRLDLYPVLHNISMITLEIDFVRIYREEGNARSNKSD